MQLTLRRANVSRKSGHWDDDDFDVFDGGGGWAQAEYEASRVN
jgi:hypothetical protein